MVGRVRKLPTQAEEAREGETDCEAESESRQHRTVDVPNLIWDCLAQPSKERQAAWQKQKWRNIKHMPDTSLYCSLWYLPALKIE